MRASCLVSPPRTRTSRPTESRSTAYVTGRSSSTGPSPTSRACCSRWELCRARTARAATYASGVQHVHLDEIEPLPALDGELQWKPVRYTLGVSAFGINAYNGAKVGDLVVEEHEDDHQELYIVVSGRASFRAGDREFDAPAGTLVLVEPGEHRVAHAAEPGTTVVAVGAESARFEPSAWEYGFRANGLIELGRYDDARAAIDEGLAQYPELGYHYTRARLAAAEGDLDEARHQLGHAAEVDEQAVTARARNDRLLAPLVGDG